MGKKWWCVTMFNVGKVVSWAYVDPTMYQKKSELTQHRIMLANTLAQRWSNIVCSTPTCIRHPYIHVLPPMAQAKSCWLGNIDSENTWTTIFNYNQQNSCVGRIQVRLDALARLFPLRDDSGIACENILSSSKNPPLQNHWAPPQNHFDQTSH